MYTTKNPIIKYGAIALLALTAACSPKSDIPPNIVEAIEAATPAGQQLSPSELEQVVQTVAPEFKITDYLAEGSLAAPYEMKDGDTLWNIWTRGDELSTALKTAYKDSFESFVRITCYESDMRYAKFEDCDADLRELQPGQSIKIYVPHDQKGRLAY